MNLILDEIFSNDIKTLNGLTKKSIFEFLTFPTLVYPEKYDFKI